jgi:hypothetical protein
MGFIKGEKGAARKATIAALQALAAGAVFVVWWLTVCVLFVGVLGCWGVCAFCLLVGGWLGGCMLCVGE